MATFAAVKAERAAVLRKTISAMRALDGRQEALERRLHSLRGKRKILEAKDVSDLAGMFRAVVTEVNKVEVSIENLATVVGG